LIFRANISPPLSIIPAHGAKQRPRTLANQIAQVDGPALAAELIDTAFTTRKPVTSTKLPVAAGV